MDSEGLPEEARWGYNHWPMPKFLITLGVILVGLGLFWPLVQRLGLGRLPGDILIKGEHTSFYFPLVTCLLVSAVLSLLFWFFR